MENLTIGQKIAKFRKEANITQNQLAEALHVSNKTISKWETDKGEPGIEFLQPISLILHCFIEELVSSDDVLNNFDLLFSFKEDSKDLKYLTASNLQRKYKIGYSKASHLLEDLESEKYIKRNDNNDGWMLYNKSKSEIAEYIENKLDYLKR